MKFSTISLFLSSLVSLAIPVLTSPIESNKLPQPIPTTVLMSLSANEDPNIHWGEINYDITRGSPGLNDIDTLVKKLEGSSSSLLATHTTPQTKLSTIGPHAAVSVCGKVGDWHWGDTVDAIMAIKKKRWTMYPSGRWF